MATSNIIEFPLQRVKLAGVATSETVTEKSSNAETDTLARMDALLASSKELARDMRQASLNIKRLLAKAT